MLNTSYKKIMKLKKVFIAIFKKYYINKFLSCENDIRFSPQNSFFSYSSIKVGKNVFINKNAYFSGDITIGDDVLIGPNVFITSGDHQYTKVGQRVQKQGRIKIESVTIENDVWVGANVSILRGVKILEGTVIGTASVVTKDMPPYCVCVGNPCKPVKLRYTDDQLIEHLGLLGKDQVESNKIIKIRHEMLKKYDLKLNL